MRKILIQLPLLLTLSACSLSMPALAGPTPVPTGTRPPTQTPSRTPSFTPTVPSPTFTPTPTLVGGRSTLAETSTFPAGTPTFVQLVLGNALTKTSFVPGFLSIILSNPAVYWGLSGSGAACEPGQTTLTAQVSEPLRVRFVTIFVRLASKQAPGSTDWDSGTLMENRGGGTFAHTLQVETLHNFQYYADGWVYLQFVSSDADGRLIHRTPVFAEDLSIARCE